MMKFIKIVAELFLPLLFIFGILPIMFRTFKSVFVEEKPKKRKHKPRMMGHRSPPPPPKSRRVGGREDSLREFVEKYEVRGGRIVKKTLAEWDEIKRKDKKERETSLKDFDTVTPNPKPTKKKHFSKGVDPDFL